MSNEKIQSVVDKSKRYNQLELGKITLTETEKSILVHLVGKSELSRYGLSTITNLAYSGVYNAVRSLLENGLVKIRRTDKGQRNANIEVEYYGITPLGIVCFLRASLSELKDYLAGYSLIDVSFRNKWHNIFDNLLNHHSYVFPEEFQKLSREFALALCADYCFIHAYAGEDPTKWSVMDAVTEELRKKDLSRHMITGISFGKEYMADLFLQIIESKTDKKAPMISGPRGAILLLHHGNEYIKSLCQFMSGKDLAILVEMVEKITLARRRNYKVILEQIKELSIYLKGVKSELHARANEGNEG